MSIAYIGLGSNLGDRLSNLRAAVDQLRNTPDIALEVVSSLYETSPIDMPISDNGTTRSAPACCSAICGMPKIVAVWRS